MRYVDASALLRILFDEPGDRMPLETGRRVVSSRIVEVEAYRALDRARLNGAMNDAETAVKRNELSAAPGFRVGSCRGTLPREPHSHSAP